MMDGLKDYIPLKGIRVLEKGHNVMGLTCGLIYAILAYKIMRLKKASNDL